MDRNGGCTTVPLHLRNSKKSLASMAGSAARHQHCGGIPWHDTNNMKALKSDQTTLLQSLKFYGVPGVSDRTCVTNCSVLCCLYIDRKSTFSKQIDLGSGIPLTRDVTSGLLVQAVPPHSTATTSTWRTSLIVQREPTFGASRSTKTPRGAAALRRFLTAPKR